MNRAFDPYEQWLGIPPGPRPPDHYRLLGVAPFDENAQRLHEQTMQRMSQVRKYQMGPQGEHALRLVQEISRAFDVLSDPARKAAYDGQLRSAATIEDVPRQPARRPESSGDPIQRLPSAAVEAVSAAEIETVVAEPEPPPVQMPVLRPVPPKTLRQRSRRSASAQPPLLLLRYLPWLGGGVVAVALVVIVMQMAGGKGTLLVQFSGLTPLTVVRLDSTPIDPRLLAQGQPVGMGMHKLEASGPDIETTVREFAVHRGQTTNLQVMLPHLAETSPRTVAPSSTKPAGPAAQPTTASPSTAPLLGSTWIGDDVYPNTSFAFESGGLLSWSHELGAYRKGTWRQIGSSLYFEQNDKFREFQGTIFSDQIVGSSTNVQGKRWTLTLRRASLTSPQLANAGAAGPPLLEGTTWSGLDNSDSKTFRFERGGILSYVAGGQDYRNGTWKQTGNVIYFETNKQYREFRGTMQGDLIEGDSWNVQGMKWKTSIRRQ